jgi:copper chaperone CopZ
MEERPVKKLMFVTLALVLGLALALAPQFGSACGGDKAKSADATKASGEVKMVNAGSESGCGSMKATEAKTDAKMVNSGSGCGAYKTSEAKAQMVGSGCGASKTTEATTVSADAHCDYTGKCATLTLSVAGMTCGGCESSVKEALMSDKGVIKVVSVDYKAGKAVVCYDPDKVESGKLAALVSDKGYKAEIMPAVATSTTDAGKGAACSISAGKCEKKSETKDGSH